MKSILFLSSLPLFGIIVITYLHFFFNSSNGSLNNFFKGLSFYLLSFNFVAGFYYLICFNKSFYGFQFTDSYNIFNFIVRFGVDGVSLFFITLTLFLTPICIILS